jgi:DnaJ-domain-containing protein 1
MLYGVVHVASSGGVNLLFHTSNLEAASSFTTSFRSFQSIRARGFDQELPRATDETKKVHPSVASIPSTVEAAMTVLGVTPEVTLEQVTTAYRHMAQMYHPDKTVGLGPELQKLADERMKEINAAHQVIRRYLEVA